MERKGMERFIVTGGAGLIGSNVVAGLNARGIEDVLVVDHLNHPGKERSLAAMGREPAIAFVDMPEHLRGKYQYFTEADTRKLRAAGCRHAFMPLEAAVADYARNDLDCRRE